MINENTQIRWASVKQLAQSYPFSESSLRYWIFNAKQNGLQHCLRKIGKKILINLEQFEKWIDSHQGRIS